MKRALNNRIPPVAVAFFCAAMMWLVSALTPGSPLPETFRLICAALFAAAAAAIGFAGVAEFRRANTTVNPLAPEKCSSLVESGIFRYTRNPMYLALLLALLGWGLFLENPWSLLLAGAYVAYMNRYQIRAEEDALESAFGEAFRRYRSRVRRWL